MKNSQTKGFANIIFIVIVVILAGALGYVTLTKNTASVDQQPSIIQNAQSTSPRTMITTISEQVGVTADWDTYKSKYYGFEFKYPEINTRLKKVGGRTNYVGPNAITSRTPFNYNECVQAGEGPGMEASMVVIANREYCRITIYGVEAEPDTFTYHYEYISHIGSKDAGINFSFSGNWDDKEKVVNEAQSLFSQILATFRIL